MKKKVITLYTLLFINGHLLFSQTVVNLPLTSQKAIVGQTIGITNITVEYCRPAVNNRVIWGNIVPYGFQSPGENPAPWRVGANENTTITFTHDVKVEGNILRAGKYGFFIAVNDDSNATIVFSKENSSWGSFFYNPSEDVLRVDVKTKPINKVEWLTFSFDQIAQQSAILSMKWADREIPLKIDIDVYEITISSLKQQFKNPVSFSWHSRNQAAAYLSANNTHLDLALQWANESIFGVPGITGFPGEKNFITLTTKSDILHAMDSVTQSQTVLKEALKSTTNDNGTPIGVVAFYGRTLITSKRIEDALIVYNWILKKWPDNWIAWHGMARALSANSNFKEALKYETEALAKVPNSNKAAIQRYIDLLKQGKDIN